MNGRRPGSRRRRSEVPGFSKETAANREDYGPVRDSWEEHDGYTLEIVNFDEARDAAPMLKGLPGDNCSCPHWGYVIRGRITYRFEDREEVREAGECFYLPPGHVPSFEAGTEFFQVSPSDQLKAVSDAIARNREAGAADSG
jgi:mannose-6-phosphate isomerase-like protein (cupin superfamily)